MKSIKKWLLLLAACSAIAGGAYSVTAAESTISLDSPTTFPLDI